MTHMVLLLRHSDKIIRGRTSPTRECDAQFTPAADLHFRGFGGVGRSLWAIAQTSLPLFTASPTNGFAPAGSRTQGGLYRKACPQFNPEGSAASSAAALFHQSLGGSGLAAGAGAHRRPWLNPGAIENCVAKFTFCRIVMCHKRCLRFIAGWCRNRSREGLSPRRG